MALIEKLDIGRIIQDENGNLIKLFTASSTVKSADGTTLDVKLAAMDAAISGQTVTKVVADIAARDALADVKIGDQVWVIDATDDESVVTGAAKYIFQSETDGWVKTAEAESMDVVTSWEDIEGKPDSAVADIDDAVSKKHEHANKTDVLDKLSVADGKLQLNGSDVGETRHWLRMVDAIPESWPTDVHPSGMLILVS